MLTWGVTALTHDASISVIDGNEILFAAHAERYSRIKNDPHLNQQLVDEALSFGQPDEIAFFESRWLKKWRQLRHSQFRYLFDGSKFPRRYLRQFGINRPVHSVRHHLSHAAAGFLTSPFKQAAILVIDSLGESNTITIWKGTGSQIRLLYSIDYPSSLGLLYTAFTQRLGLKPNEDEYITMGMAAYGEPIYAERICEDFIDPRDFFRLKKNVIRGISNWMPDAEPVNIAASIQKVAEQKISLLGALAASLVRSPNLVFMGGVALNCVANNLLRQFFQQIWIMPNPGDAGSSLGCAAYLAGKRLTWRGPYLGTTIDHDYPVDDLLKELLAGHIVGVANGRAEFGPRALGNRSLLADPRPEDMKDRVNVIKQRQKFRPFAPAILEQHASEYFRMEDSSPYMQYTVQSLTDSCPAINHIDGTSRVQTVNEEQHAGFYELLRRWYERTGCPMLLNTSLNIKGMPMVNDRLDADDFERTYGVTVLS